MLQLQDSIICAVRRQAIARSLPDPEGVHHPSGPVVAPEFAAL
jgi:hypothetical protein